ncbi:MAG: NHL repeat-containing protein [Paracoccaceae bacterium]|nr:NHL repeat-containing protein [Paracoccaceae bacterium]
MTRAIAFAVLISLPAQAEEAPPFASFDLASEPVLADPHDLEIGPDGRLYVADKFGARVAVFDPETLELVEMLGEGFLPGVHDISFGPTGSIAIAVTGVSAVALYPDIDALKSPPEAAVSAPRTEGALLHSNGDLYVTAGGVGTLMRYRDGELLGAVGSHMGAHDVAEGPDGSVWVADNFNRRLVRYSPDLEEIQVINDAKYGFVGARYMDVTDGGLLVVADQDAHRILLIDPEETPEGRLLGILGDGSPGLGPGKFDDPEGVEVSGNRYYFADSDNNRIVRYSVVLN